MVLICILLLMLSIFSIGSAVTYLLWCSFCSNLLPIFTLGYVFPYCWALRVLLSQYIACIFILLTASFAEQKHLLFMNSDWSIFSFIGSVFGVMCKNHFPNFRAQRFSFVFFQKFYILHSDLWLILREFLSKVSSIDQGSFFYLWMSSCFSTICWENYPFSIELTLLIC